MSISDSAAEAPAPDAIGGLLVALQLGDSFFPGGGSAFSWGLESMLQDDRVEHAADITALLEDLLRHRWAALDRPLMRAAHDLAADRSQPLAAQLDGLTALDELCEAMTLNSGARSASRRLGFTQLRVHAELGVAAAAAYLAHVRSGRAPGHLPVVQGWVWHARGLALDAAEAIAGFGLCTAVAGAAIRLGRIGHLDAQRLLERLHATLRALLAAPAPPLDDLWSGTPALDIASLRHEPRAARLFAN